jgi:hypothetical protein
MVADRAQAQALAQVLVAVLALVLAPVLVPVLVLAGWKRNRSMEPAPRTDPQPPQWRSWLAQWSATDCLMNGIFITAMSLFVRHVFHEPILTNVCGVVGPVLIIVGITRLVLVMDRR